MEFNNKKLEMLDKFNVLETEKQEIMAQGQQLQNRVQQIQVEQATLNIKLKFIEELESEEKE